MVKVSTIKRLFPDAVGGILLTITKFVSISIPNPEPIEKTSKSKIVYFLKIMKYIDIPNNIWEKNAAKIKFIILIAHLFLKL